MTNTRAYATTNASRLAAIHAHNMRAPFAPRSRKDAISVLTRRIEFHYWPRWSAFWISVVTALFGVLFSAILWRAGVEAMTWRYPIAVLLSYLVLLLLLASWSHRHWDDWFQFDGSPSQPSSSGGGNGRSCSGHVDYAGGGGDFGGAGASGSFDSSVALDASANAMSGAGSDVASSATSFAGDVVSGGLEAAASADEGVVIVVPLVLITGLLALFGGFAFGVIALIWSAPTLLAHLMLDAGTASVLYVYARPAQKNSWLGTALWRTFPAFLGLAALGLLIGYGLELFDPTAITIFDVLANR
jgi:hypothetical protein